jgi:hypothetical protein
LYPAGAPGRKACVEAKKPEYPLFRLLNPGFGASEYLEECREVGLEAVKYSSFEDLYADYMGTMA